VCLDLHGVVRRLSRLAVPDRSDPDKRTQLIDDTGQFTLRRTPADLWSEVARRS
jgi:hypothetical protein